MARIFYLLSLMILLTSTTMAMAEPTKKFKVLTSFTIIADIAKNIAGDVAQVESLTKVNAEIHNYQVTPSDIRRAVDADLLLYNGLNLERWFDKFLNNLAGVPREVISKNIIPLGIGLGPYKGKPNPHAWMSADNAIIYIDNVRAALVKHDPKNTATYNNNAKIYTAKLQAELAPLKQQLSRIPAEQRWLVTSEGAFSYLARDYQLKELYLWPINADAQGTPQQIRHVIDKINANNINTIFSESTVSAKPAQQVARATNIHYGGVLYVDSLSNKQGPVPSYIELLKVTLTTIHQGLLQQ
ncbi:MULTISPECIES: metal ABC transporter substrate-binding protein [Colwellia]|uniref:Metal ABC transporter substrate-binding protein n=1 Tax=Colwellia marinimaniae TaxID=1513592 RepID=A0ABQ0MSF2_9GAMM|nr:MULTISPECIES: metal ABC transporter substrate-binding protein [Colwellia]GAW95137.1 metal ABC transporter substrate-binding protein [Colwellia marinimaniae]